MSKLCRLSLARPDPILITATSPAFAPSSNMYLDAASCSPADATIDEAAAPTCPPAMAASSFR